MNGFLACYYGLGWDRIFEFALAWGGLGQLDDGSGWVRSQKKDPLTTLAQI